MRAVFLSDLHVDINRGQPVVREFSALLREQSADLAVVAGDISEDQEETLCTVRGIEDSSGVQVLYVPGNHDLWGREPEEAERRYARYCADSRCLCGRDAVFGDLAFLGDVGWYDYSFGSGRYTREDFDRMELAGRVWQDSLRNAWTRDNPGRSRWMLRRLEMRMKAHPDKRLVLVTHMLPVREFTVPPEQGKWSYFNAFLGSRSLGELYRRYPVTAAVCGHVHYRRSFDRDGVHWMCRCLNYESEWRPEHGSSCREQMEHAAEVLDL